MVELNPALGPFDDFYMKNKNLVYHFINKVIGRTRSFRDSSISYEDFVSVGTLAFMHAYRYFDPSMGSQFSTYVGPVIMGHIKRFLRDTHPIHLSRPMYSTYSFLFKHDLLDKSIEYILEHFKEDLLRITGLFEDKLLPLLITEAKKLSLSMYNPTSFDQVLSVSDNLFVKDMIVSPSDETSRYWSLVDDFASRLSKKNALLFKLAASEMTQAEIGQRLGVSQVQVSRLLAKLKPIFKTYLSEEEETPSFQIGHSSPIIKPKEVFGPMPKIADSVIDEIITLLKTTKLPATQIASKFPNVPYYRVAALARLNRSPELRKEINALCGLENAKRTQKIRNAKKVTVEKPAEDKPEVQVIEVVKPDLPASEPVSNESSSDDIVFTFNARANKKGLTAAEAKQIFAQADSFFSMVPEGQKVNLKFELSSGE